MSKPLKVVILEKALARISDYTRWTQLAEGRSIHGNNISPNSRHAVGWCAIGAIKREIFEMGIRGAEARRLRIACREPLDEIAERAGEIAHGPDTLWYVEELNDQGSWASVLLAFEVAIKEAMELAATPEDSVDVTLPITMPASNDLMDRAEGEEDDAQVRTARQQDQLCDAPV